MTGSRIMIARPVTAAALEHPAGPGALEQPPARLRTRCCAAGPYDLSPGVRLPAGRRLSEDRGHGRLHGLEHGTCGAGH
jgi:hypothetical protein